VSEQHVREHYEVKIFLYKYQLRGFCITLELLKHFFCSFCFDC